MAGSIGSPPGQWRYGIHPRATGSIVRSIGRVELQLGEALRLELADDDAGDPDVVHVQYYIATDLGPWALWLSCSWSDLDANEAVLREIALPVELG